MRRAITFFIVTIVIVVVWWLPLVRAMQFFKDASQVYAETSSINAWNDFNYSRNLLISYTFSLLISAVTGWVFCKTRIWLLLLPLGISFLIAFALILLKPENVIVLIPPLTQGFLPAFFSTIVAAIGAAIVSFARYIKTRP